MTFPRILLAIAGLVVVADPVLEPSFSLGVRRGPAVATHPWQCPIWECTHLLHHAIEGCNFNEGFFEFVAANKPGYPKRRRILRFEILVATYNFLSPKEGSEFGLGQRCHRLVQEDLNCVAPAGGRTVPKTSTLEAVRVEAHL